MAQEQPVRIARRLSAILVADVAAYSRLMHHDEEATHAKLTTLLTDKVAPSVAEHGGRIVKNTGDGFLAEFPSAVEAVRSALRFQTLINELTVGDVEDKRIAFRVGINIGDVIVEPHDIFGDGVNIAARLESIAEPGGICISSSAYENVYGKVNAKFVNLGEQTLKNIPSPVRAYAVVWEEHNPATRAECSRPDARPAPHLSVVVLPFGNISSDPGQDYFVDGVTESLTTDLSRISGSFVIGRHTAFTYKGKAVDLRQVGRELNVRYVLEGSVQRGDGRLRVNVQLVDAETGAHLWAERFDKPVANLFDMQDEIVSRLANTLDAQLTEQEARRSEQSPHPNSMDLYFRGKALLYKGWTPEYLAQARELFEQAVALDIKNVEAMLWIATVDVIAASAFVGGDRTQRFAAAETTALEALSVAPNHAFAHVVLGVALMHTNRAGQAITENERALALDRNLALADVEIGVAKYFMGRGAETEDHVNEAFRLSPRDIFAYDWMMMVGFAKLQIGADTEATDWFSRSKEANRNHPLAHFGLAAALALVGSLDQARTAANAGLGINPSFTVRRFRDAAFSDNPIYLAGRERVYQGLRMAGVPED